MSESKKLSSLLIIFVAYFLSFHLSLGFLFGIELPSVRVPLTQLNIWYSIGSLLLVFALYLSRIARHLIKSLIFISIIIRVLDWNIFFFYGKHIDNIFWNHALYFDGVSMAMNNTSIFLIALGALVYIVFRILIKRPYLNFKGKILIKVFLFFLAYLSISTFFLDKYLEKYGPDTDLRRLVYKSIPEIEFAKSVRSYFFGNDELLKELPKITQHKLHHLSGVKLNSVSDRYPFFKDSIYLQSDSKINGEEARKLFWREENSKPNIVVILLEGFSAGFLTEKKFSERKIMKNIEEAKAQSFSFDNVYNSNTPTFQGQIAVLASMLNFNETTIDKKRVKSDSVSRSVLTKFPFVSAITKREGYRNVNIQSLGIFADSQKTFLNNDFDEYYSIENEDYKKFVGEDIGHWGASDKSQFEFLVDILKNHNEKKPLFVSFKTTDLHHPYDCAYKRDDLKNKILNCLYSTDLGFGVFWKYFKSSRYFDNTVLVVTADHSLFPTYDHLKLRDNFSGGYYDKVPLFFISKHTVKNPRSFSIKGSSLDVIPTLMDLISWDSANSFMGLSLISERHKYPLILAKKFLHKENTPTDWNEQDHLNLRKFVLYQTQSNALVPQVMSGSNNNNLSSK